MRHRRPMGVRQHDIDKHYENNCRTEWFRCGTRFAESSIFKTTRIRRFFCVYFGSGCVNKGFSMVYWKKLVFGKRLLVLLEMFRCGRLGFPESLITENLIMFKEILFSYFNFLRRFAIAFYSQKCSIIRESTIFWKILVYNIEIIMGKSRII